MSKLFAFVCLLSFIVHAIPGYEREAHYSDAICAIELLGTPTNYGAYKPDCETKFAAIEFDWAIKHKIYECLGQALMYASLTGKIPVCYIMATSQASHDLAVEFKEAADLGNIKLIIERVGP